MIEGRGSDEDCSSPIRSREAVDRPVPTGRVGDRRAGLGRCLCSLLPRPFCCEVSQHRDVFSLRHVERKMRIFRFLRSPACFAPTLMGPILLGNFRLWSPNLVAVEQLQGIVQPLPTPPLRAEALRLERLYSGPALRGSPREAPTSHGPHATYWQWRAEAARARDWGLCRRICAHALLLRIIPRTGLATRISVGRIDHGHIVVVASDTRAPCICLECSSSTHAADLKT